MYFQIPDKASYSAVLYLIQNKILSPDHIAIYHLLEEIVFNGMPSFVLVYSSRS